VGLPKARPQGRGLRTTLTELIARGKDISDGLCGACHSKTGTLTGGYDVAVELQVPIGSFVAANLTPAGSLKHWSDGEIFRAIRNGVDAEGRWLTMMSYVNAGRLSDDDIEAVIAYIRSVGNPTPDPPDHMNMLGLAMLGAGMLPSGKPIITETISGPLKGPTSQFGEYILAYQDCRECHGKPDRWRARAVGAARTRPESGQGLDAGRLHRSHAYRHRSQRSSDQRTNAVAFGRKNG
jgi:mono/diheme cytochrome c family protein